ncbi:MAG: O-antigen ligase family protein [Anaerolineae bacterium]|nr:O-antigen ligase family protein [Anaerolineae bacterium]
MLLGYLLPRLGAWPLVIALAPCAARLSLCGYVGRRTCFETPLALFLLTAAVSVWAAYDRDAAWAKFWLIIGGVLLLYALANAGLQPVAMAWIPAIGGACLALYFVLTHDWSAHAVKAQVITDLGVGWQSLRPTVPGPRLNANEAGGVLAMLAPFAVWNGWHTWHGVKAGRNVRRAAMWLSPIAATGALTLILLGLLSTQSRGAWLALAASAVCAGAWFFAGRMTRRRPEWRRGAWVALLLLAAAAGIVAGIGLRGSDVLARDLFSTDSLLSRFGFHRDSLLLASDYPLIGAGLDGFQMLYSSYAMLIHVGFIEHSHNLFLSLAIDQGLPGLLALLWMWGMVAVAAWRGAAGAGEDTEQSLAPQLGVAALSIVVILVHGFVDTALYGKFVFLLFLPVAFAALRPGPRRESRRRAVPRPWMVGLAALAIPTLLWPGRTLSLVYSNLGAVRQSQAELRVYSWPEWPLQDAVRRAVDLDPAVGAFERALALNEANATANRRLGMIELSLGEYEDALAHLRRAYTAEPWSTTTRQLFGEALIANGYQDEGEVLWANVNNEQGQLAARVFWYGYIEDAGREAAIRRAAQGQ